RLQPEEQARAAALAEAPLGPVRGIVSAEMLLAVKDDAARDGRERRPSGPAPTHAAVADVVLLLERLDAELHCTAQAASRGSGHSMPPSSARVCLRAAIIARRPGRARPKICPVSRKAGADRVGPRRRLLPRRDPAEARAERAASHRPAGGRGS